MFSVLFQNDSWISSRVLICSWPQIWNDFCQNVQNSLNYQWSYILISGPRCFSSVHGSCMIKAPLGKFPFPPPHFTSIPCIIDYSIATWSQFNINQGNSQKLEELFTSATDLKVTAKFRWACSLSRTCLIKTSRTFDPVYQDFLAPWCTLSAQNCKEAQ